MTNDEYSPYADPDIGRALCHEAQRAAETAEKFRGFAQRARAMVAEFEALAVTTVMDPDTHAESGPDLVSDQLNAYMRDTIAEHMGMAALTFLAYAGAWDAEGERYAAAILEAKAED